MLKTDEERVTTNDNNTETSIYILHTTVVPGNLIVIPAPIYHKRHLHVLKSNRLWKIRL